MKRDDLRAELDRLLADNADLRASALLWKRLYEGAVNAALDGAAASLTPMDRHTPAWVDDMAAHGARVTATVISRLP